MRGDEPDLIFIEGIRLAEEAIRSGIAIREAFVTDLDTDERKLAIVSELEAISCPVWQVSASVAATISDTKNPQGLFAIASRPRWTLADIRDGLAVYLHEINNPSNLGAIIRTAEAAGVAGVLISEHSADAFSPKSLRGAMGSAFRVPIVIGLGMDHAFEWAADTGRITTAADVNGETSYRNVDWSNARLLVFGSEAHGLARSVRDRIQELITIPMKGSVESLNLAVSAGIIMFEAER